MSSMLNERINELKSNIHALWERVRKSDDEMMDEVSDADVDRNYEDDLPLTLSREDGPGVRYYTTENSPFAVGEEKIEHAGIDSFGEDDSPDPEQLSTREY